MSIISFIRYGVKLFYLFEVLPVLFPWSKFSQYDIRLYTSTEKPIPSHPRRLRLNSLISTQVIRSFIELNKNNAIF